MEGVTHEQVLPNGLMKGIRSYGELTNIRKANDISADDVMGSLACMLSVFIPNPEFQGQTKEKLSTQSAIKLVENAVREHFDHWLSGSPKDATRQVEWLVERSEERARPESP